MDTITEICFGNADLVSLGLNIELETKDYTVTLVANYFSKKPNDVQPFDPPFCPSVIKFLHLVSEVLEEKMSGRFVKKFIITLCHEIQEETKNSNPDDLRGDLQKGIAKCATSSVVMKLSENPEYQKHLKFLNFVLVIINKGSYNVY